MKVPEDITGKRFNRLVVAEFVGRNRHSQQEWRCLCDCGNTTVVVKGALTTGAIRSCGCLMRETNSRRGKERITHGGMAGGRPTPEFTAWMNAKARCYDPNNNRFYAYGAKGITMCDRWRDSFAAFLSDMGKRPSSAHSLDRFPDHHGPYAPDNCRWATRIEQMRNRPSNIPLTFRGETKCLTEWEDALGLERGLIHSRLKHGWSAERALSEPSHYPGNSLYRS